MPIDFAVSGLVPAIQQPLPNACWATAAAILYSWKNNASCEVATFLSNAAPDFFQIFTDDTGLFGDQKPAFLNALGLTAEAPQDFTVDGWLQLLQSCGPLWLTTDEGSGQVFSAHARILRGLSGNGDPDSTLMDIVDPGDGTEYTESVTVFMRKFDDVARADLGDGADFRPQVVHY